jgi:hypothetical protein
MRIRMVKILLVLMTLSGIIMPIHAYAHELTEATESHAFELDTQHDSDTGAISCDHCCHFSSHSLGILQNISIPTNERINEILNFQDQNYLSFQGLPIFKPPIT